LSANVRWTGIQQSLQTYNVDFLQTMSKFINQMNSVNMAGYATQTPPAFLTMTQFCF